MIKVLAPQTHPLPMSKFPAGDPRLSNTYTLPSEYLSPPSRKSTSTVGTALTANTSTSNSSVVTSPPSVESHLRPHSLSAVNQSSALLPAAESPWPQSLAKPIAPQSTKNKKRPSFLGTLFTKEPSTDAFRQMQRKHVAQNPGGQAPNGMSGVSSFKMPEHVPKVNSKWDGMPRSANEQDGRTNSRPGSWTTSARTSSTHSRSANHHSRDSHHTPPSRNTTSSQHVEQRASYKSGHLAGLPAAFMEVHSLPERVPSSDSPTNFQSKNVLELSPSPQSPSARSPSQITTFYPNDLHELPSVCRLPALSPDPAQGSTREGVTQRIARTEKPIAEDIMYHTISANASPEESSPITPLWAPESGGHGVKSSVETDESPSYPVLDRRLTQLGFHSSRPHGQDPPVPTRKLSTGSMVKKDTHEPALASSSQVRQDLQERPDSSRSRLGLKASMIKSSDAAPWEAEEKESRSGVRNQAVPPKHPRARALGIFGKN